ncbi:head completion/stabilization protein [Photobacterium sp. DA100]|uniref:head completion/stabilization protein n=1 Tax=Photobacterium sp. DA100 TaxID=3027472 RepID=UPI00247A8BFF|nr:head completion/stabilization protein [Photobacterium sp. DA100]WEM43507.1 head completion/stabilization protein [Photobacterium sp. DA100]
MSFGGKSNTDVNTNIPGNGWPDLSTEEFRRVRRIPTVFDNDSMEMAIRIASKAVKKQLVSLLNAEGQPPKLDDDDTAIYKRAVYGRAHGDLLPEFATQDRRKEANNLATDSQEQQDDFIAQSNRDTRLLLGLGRASVGVI